jgi:hypothetical protein
MKSLITDYLPPSGASVRFRAESEDGSGCETRLVRVERLASLCLRNPKAKISVAYASFRGGQCSTNVVRCYSIGIDLDGLAKREDIRSLQTRFPGSAIVYGNGLTLLYTISSGIKWVDAALTAYQIGVEAAKLTGLKFDWKTLLRGDGRPGKHENHLFRYPAGWASKRGGVVEFYSPHGASTLMDDAFGLSHSLPAVSGPRRPTPGSGNASLIGEPECGGDSQKEEHGACSIALGIRRRVLRLGGSLLDAIKMAADETGKTEDAIALLYAKPGYGLADCSSNSAVGFMQKLNDGDVGFFGLESTSRPIQRSRTMSANFGHSLQSFWDANCSAEIACADVLSLPIFEPFRAEFKERFGAEWEKAVSDDILRCWHKFGKGGPLPQVSRNCIADVRVSLTKGPISAVSIAKVTGYSLRQIKRALKEMLARSEVAFTGVTKLKAWSFNPCHTEELVEVGEGGVGPSFDVLPLPSTKPVLVTPDFLKLDMRIESQSRKTQRTTPWMQSVTARCYSPPATTNAQKRLYHKLHDRRGSRAGTGPPCMSRVASSGASRDSYSEV